MADTFKGIVTADGKKRQLPYGSILDIPKSDPSLTVEGGFADAAVVGKKNKKTDETIASLKEDISDQESKLEPIVKSNEDSKNVFYIVDADGNIICKVDKDGVHSVGFDGKNLALNDVISTYDDSFYISDSKGNIIFKANKDGVQGLNMNNTPSTKSPYNTKKLISIGDSLSAHDKWQKWLVEWLGLNFDLDENINGKDGHAPMSVGGTGIRPKGTNSIYIRALDAKYYVDDVNGTIIIIYAGQNDYLGTGNRLLGTIEDIPYKGRAVSTDADSLTFYSFYKGMIENLLEDCPKARICLMTQMQIWQSENTVENGETEAVRFEKVKAIREIGNYYGLTVIDQWSNSGINHLNASVYYPSIGNVHQNDLGYKVTAETVCKYL